MKKLMILFVALMLTAFAHAETNPWSLEGTFVDADNITSFINGGDADD